MDRLVITLPVEDGLHLVAHARGTAYCGAPIEPHMIGCRKEWEHTDKPRCLRCELALVRADRVELVGLLKLALMWVDPAYTPDWVDQGRAAIKRWG